MKVKNILFEEVLLNKDNTPNLEAIKKLQQLGLNSVPQVFIGNALIGGYEDTLVWIGELIKKRNLEDGRRKRSRREGSGNDGHDLGIQQG